jgi:hypothetical protein
LWKAIAKEVGATPRATCQKGVAKMLPGRVFLVHNESLEVFRAYQRWPRIRVLNERWVAGRKSETLGHLILLTAQDLEARRSR